MTQIYSEAGVKNGANKIRSFVIFVRKLVVADPATINMPLSAADPWKKPFMHAKGALKTR